MTCQRDTSTTSSSRTTSSGLLSTSTLCITLFPSKLWLVMALSSQESTLANTPSMKPSSTFTPSPRASSTWSRTRLFCSARATLALSSRRALRECVLLSARSTKSMTRTQSSSSLQATKSRKLSSALRTSEGESRSSSSSTLHLLHSHPRHHLLITTWPSSVSREDPRSSPMSRKHSNRDLGKEESYLSPMRIMSTSMPWQQVIMVLSMMVN